jgi:hypothetical protein
MPAIEDHDWRSHLGPAGCLRRANERTRHQVHRASQNADMCSRVPLICENRTSPVVGLTSISDTQSWDILRRDLHTHADDGNPTEDPPRERRAVYQSDVDTVKQTIRPFEVLRGKLITAPALCFVNPPLTENVDQSKLPQDLHSGVVPRPRLEPPRPVDTGELLGLRIPVTRRGMKRPVRRSRKSVRQVVWIILASLRCARGRPRSVSR